LDPESNICYGEGGAGTFSDGKLNTGVADAHSKFVLEEFVKHGAKKDILWDATPHIGSDYLQTIVSSFRQEIVSLGGEVLFECKFTGLLLEGTSVVGVTYEKDGVTQKLVGSKVFLALGHSPYDTMAALVKQGLVVQAKDFSIGFRIEHPQAEIDRANYHQAAGTKGLPPSSYHSVVHLPNGRSVYSFCMCPGGEVVNSSSSLGTVLTNGMSNNARAAVNGNSALLVNVRVGDFGSADPLAGFLYRGKIEQAAFCKDKPYFAPAETIGDFLAGKTPSAFGKVQPSYRPGVYLADLAAFLPPFISEALRQAWGDLEARQAFYQDHDAVITGFETRSSSPVRIPRDVSGQANLLGLYPLGEGASYAGGITSAALDGLKIALQVLAAPL
jgi:uncharacterized FAD-dependent dehydrogenase